LKLSHKLGAQEKEMIEFALRDSGGRVFGPSGAAAKVGISRSTLESKIASLKIGEYRFKTASARKVVNCLSPTRRNRSCTCSRNFLPSLSRRRGALEFRAHFVPMPCGRKPLRGFPQAAVGYKFTELTCEFP
jgi:hypothetical protein